MVFCQEKQSSTRKQSVAGQQFMSLMFFFLWFVLFLFVMKQKKEMNRKFETHIL